MFGFLNAAYFLLFLFVFNFHTELVKMFSAVSQWFSAYSVEVMVMCMYMACGHI